jgi:cardiolipin synthase
VYFPKKHVQDGHVPMQIVASSPAEDWHQIEFGYTKIEVYVLESSNPS